MVAGRDLSRSIDSTAPADKTAVIFVDETGERQLSYGEVNALISAAAERIARDTPMTGAVGVLAENCPAYFIACMGAARAGVAAVPINQKLKTTGVEYICADADVRVIYCDDANASLAPTSVEVRDIASFERNDSSRILAEAGGNTRPRDANALIMYTSGSTGRPKGVPITHDGYVWALEQFSFLSEVINGGRVLLAAPLYHMNAQFHILNALSVGGTAVLMARFDAKRFLEVTERHQVGRLTGVPTMFELAMREIEHGVRFDGAHVTSVAMGSAPVSDNLLERLDSAFPNASVSNGYGTTEVGPAIFGLHPDGKLSPPGSIGYPMSGVQIRLDGSQHANQGVLSVKSPMTTRGYLNLPEANAEKFDNGWYVTGDVMRRDDDGFFYFVGRDDDMFVSGGENIYPGAVEAVLDKIDGVLQSAVVPIDDPVKGAVPVAFIVAREDLDEKTIKDAFIARGPAYAHPRFVAFKKSLPLTAVKKIDRRLLSREAIELFAGRRA